MTRVALVALHAAVAAVERAVARAADVPAGAPLEVRACRWCAVAPEGGGATMVLWLAKPAEECSPDDVGVGFFNRVDRGRVFTVMADFAPDGAPSVALALTACEVTGWRAERLRAAWRGWA